MIDNKVEAKQQEIDRLAKEWIDLVLKQIMEKSNSSDTRCLLVKKVRKSK